MSAKRPRASADAKRPRPSRPNILIAPIIKMGAQPSTTREEDFIQARQTCESMIQECTREKNDLESRIKACEKERQELEEYYRELLKDHWRQAQQQEEQQEAESKKRLADERAEQEDKAKQREKRAEITRRRDETMKRVADELKQSAEEISNDTNLKTQLKDVIKKNENEMIRNIKSWKVT